MNNIEIKPMSGSPPRCGCAMIDLVTRGETGPQETERGSGSVEQANILIVDDEPSVHRILSLVLTRNGYACKTASNAAEARVLLETQAFDLLLCDIRMPGESGLDLVRYLAQAHPETAVIMVTGVDTAETAREAMSIGVYGYLLKPFETTQVLISVMNALRRRELERRERDNRSRLERAVEEKTAELREKLQKLEQAQKELNESEERYRTAIELSDDGVSIICKGKIIYANQRLAQIHGYDRPDEMIGESLSALIHPHEIEQQKAIRSRTTEDATAPSRHITHCLKRDGTGIYVEVSVSRISYKGEPCTLCFVRDVTERRAAEEALKESEANFRAISESAQDAIIKTDGHGKISFWNRAAQEIFGYTKEEAVGRDVHDLLAPPRLAKSNREAFKAFQSKAQGDPGGRTLELKAMRKGGEEFPVEVSVSSVMIRGERAGVGILRDISERKAIENQLLNRTRSLEKAKARLAAEHEAMNDLLSRMQEMTAELEIKNSTIESDRKKLALALDEISSLIQKVAKEKDFSIRFGNPTLAKCHEVMGCDRPDCPCYGKQAMRCWQIAGTFCHGKAQGAFAQKYENCCKECRVFCMAAGDPVYQIGEHFNNMMHILEGKNQSLQTAYRELKDTQALVVQQEKLASIGQLAAGVAHEINNPTGFISSNLKTLSDYLKDLFVLVEDYLSMKQAIQGNGLAAGSLSSLLERIEQRESAMDLPYILEDTPHLLEESREGTDRIRKIVQDLKDFAHPGKQELVYADINRNLDSTLNIVWNELKYKARVVKDYGVLPEVRCFPQQLNQVFMNLLVNAGQAIEKDGVITISTRAENGHVEVRISDTGIGIPAENLTRIFEPFFTTKEVGKGTGLGLNVAYNIIKKHRGSIELDSAVGKGTTFTIRVPVDAETYGEQEHTHRG
ncbi:MAG: PAS domain S-box protein [Thermodesulfobacteriota bacterium]